MTTGEFFRPFEGIERPFNHDWPLLGREPDVEALLDALSRPCASLVLLLGPGGMGKSRLLREAMDRLAAREGGTLLRFASTTAEVTRRALEELGAGPKLLVVDDAHDRDDLGVLLAYAADPVRQARLLLATRPYAQARIRQQASVQGIAEAVEVHLERLARAQLRELAADVLRTFGAPEDYAGHIVQVAGNSP